MYEKLKHIKLEINDEKKKLFNQYISLLNQQL